MAKWTAATGQYAWALQVGGTGTTGSNEVSAVVLQGTTLYLAGEFSGANAPFGLVSLTSAGLTDVFVAKLTDLGTSSRIEWAQQYGGVGNDRAEALERSGNTLYVVGSFTASVAFGPVVLTSTQNEDIFAVKLTDTGAGAAVSWAQWAGGMGADRVADLAINGSALYLVGECTGGSPTFGTTTLNAPQGTNGYLAKLVDGGSSAAFGWAQLLGGSRSDEATAVALNGPTVYVAGMFSGSVRLGATTLFSTGSQDLYVAKYQDTGPAVSPVWAERAGGASFEYPPDLALSGTRLYLAGAVSDGVASFGGSLTLNVPAARSYDLFVARLTDNGPNGTFEWVQSAGSTAYDIAGAVALSNTTVYVSGVVQAPATFGSLAAGGPAAGVFMASLTDAPPTPVPALVGISPGTGPVGSLLTLTGTGLAGATSINFAGPGGVQATGGYAVNAAGTEIIAVEVPAGAQSGSVTVTTPGGTSNAVSYTVTTSPLSTPPAWQGLQAVGAVQTSTAGSDVTATATDAQGNLYVLGTFSGTVRLGGFALTATGRTDLYVAKFLPATGTYTWVRTAGGTGQVSLQPGGVAVVGTAVYVGGAFTGAAATFGPHTGTAAGATGNTVFVAKLLDTGSATDFAWVRTDGGPGTARVTGLVANGTGVFVAGSFNGNRLSFNNGAAFAANQSFSASSTDWFVARYTDTRAGARFDWVERAGGLGNDEPQALASNGTDVYAAGQLDGDVYLTKLTDLGTSGTVAWTVQSGSAGTDEATDLIVQGSTLYVVGTFRGIRTPFGPYLLSSAEGSDLFVARLTDTGSAGRYDWVRRGGGAGGRRHRRDSGRERPERVRGRYLPLDPGPFRDGGGVHPGVRALLRLRRALG